MKAFGDFGEQVALHFLEQNGYQILEQNFRFEHAEIDIICQKENELVFVEVKTRSGNQFGEPEQAVTPAKQKLMARAAAAYIDKIEHKGELRYDIIAIKMNKKEVSEILHLEDAFFPIG